MDHEYRPDEFARASINGSSSNIGDCRDAQNTHDGGYSARWRVDRQLEKNGVVGHGHAHFLNARAKVDKVYQHDLRPTAPGEPTMIE